MADSKGFENSRSRYIGRFAPSPTGDLHFGSLVAAVASFLQARCSGGTWLVRIEDIDPPREVEGSAGRIVADLDRLGMHPDQEILHQSTRVDAFRAARDQLLGMGHAFYCSCSRKSLPDDGIYPGTCREGPAAGSNALSIRVRVSEESIGFVDGVQGAVCDSLERLCGDFVIWRADDLPAYQLAVVVDDAHQGITEVVRGADLLDSTAKQIFLQQLLGLPTPEYSHLPVATEDGKKLSKRLGSDPISALDPVESVYAALTFLGMDPPPITSLEELWGWAREHWALERVPGQRCRPAIGFNGFLS